MTLIPLCQPDTYRTRSSWNVSDAINGEYSLISAFGGCYLLLVLNEDLHHDILELEVHDGGHRVLLWPHQRRAEDHAQIGHRHQILLAVGSHAVG